MEDIVNFVLKG